MNATVQAIRNFCTSQPICGSTATVLAGAAGAKLPSPAKFVQAFRPSVGKQISGPPVGQKLVQPIGTFGYSPAIGSLGSLAAASSGPPVASATRRGASSDRS